MLSIGTALTILAPAAIPTAETVAFTSPVVVVPKDAVMVLILCQCAYILDASCTNWHARLRRGTLLTDPLLLDQGNLNTVGGNRAAFQLQHADVVSGLATVQYSYTVQTIGSVGANTGVEASIAVIFLQ